MIGIKKVQVVPLDINYGKIINSFNTTDDKTQNAPSINAVEQAIEGVNQDILDTNSALDNLEYDLDTLSSNVYNKGDFALIEFNITTTQLDTSTDVNYPTGFTKTNTNVISILSQKGSDDFVTYSENDTLRQSKGSGFRLFLKDDKMVFHILKGSSEASNFTANIRLLLMKIDTGE